MGVPVLVALSVSLPLSELVPELEAEAPSVRDSEFEALTVVLPLTVGEGAPDAVPASDPARVVPVGEPVPLWPAPAPLLLKELLAVIEGGALGPSEAVGGAPTVVLPLTVEEGVLVGEADGVPLAVLIPLAAPLLDGEAGGGHATPRSTLLLGAVKPSITNKYPVAFMATPAG